MIELQVLGPIEVEDAGERLTLPQSRKTRALLAYLALAPRPVSRDRLCELFWSLPDDPRGALRWSLTKLRRLLDRPGRPVVLADRETVSLDPGLLTVDLSRVREDLRDGIDAASTPALQAAAGRFRGNALSDLDLPSQAEVQSWVATVREEARRLHAAVLTALDDRHAASPEQALPYVRALVELDPSAENAWGRLLERLRRLGRTRELEEQYAAAVVALQDFGGVSHLLEQARRGTEAVAAPARTAPDEIRQEIRFCRAVGGARIAYAESGRGPPLVKAANWMNHLEFDWESPIWGHFLQGLSREFRLCRYDARGNGLSDWDVDELGLEAWVSDLEAVVDAAGLERFPLLGVSQGCAISVAYAVRHPERVSHLILYAGSPAGTYAREGNAEEREQRQALTTLMRTGWGQANPAFRQVFTSMLIPGATREQADAFNELQRRTTSPECAVRYFEATGRLDVRDLLPRVTAPTLVMHPRGDLDTPVELGRQLAAGIPGARFMPLSGRNHLFLAGEPAEAQFFDELRRFLRT